MHLIGFLVLGAIVGSSLGSWVPSSEGGFVFSLIFGTAPTGLVMSFIVGLVGAIVVVAIVHMIRREAIRA